MKNSQFKFLFCTLIILSFYGCQTSKPLPKFVEIPGRNWESDNFECTERASALRSGDFGGWWEMCMRGKGYKTRNELGGKIFATPSSKPQWKIYGDTERGDQFYYDPSVYVSPGVPFGFWVMHNYTKPLEAEGGPPVYSKKEYFEFDCPSFEMRSHTLIFYSRNNGSGSITYSRINQSDDWQRPRANSAAEALLQKMCTIFNNHKGK